MQLFWTAVFLLLCQTIEKWECKIFEYQSTPENAADVINRTDKYGPPRDFRCYKHALKDFDDFEGKDYTYVRYTTEILRGFEILGCTMSQGKVTYPPLTGSDPMMIAPVYSDYWERFHSESDICEKIVETIKRCSVYRQIQDMFVTKLHEKLCLDEDGCYNVMTYYDDDLPYCVKTTAISQFRNSSVGSWHHAMINYCKLTEMVPEAKIEKYDMKILTQKGRTRENLREMCLYLRYRVLPEEGKEQEIPEEVYDDDAVGTTDEYHTGTSILITISWWSVVYLIVAHL